MTKPIALRVEDELRGLWRAGSIGSGPLASRAPTVVDVYGNGDAEEASKVLERTIRSFIEEPVFAALAAVFRLHPDVDPRLNVTGRLSELGEPRTIRRYAAEACRYLGVWADRSDDYEQANQLLVTVSGDCVSLHVDALVMSSVAADPTTDGPLVVVSNLQGMPSDFKERSKYPPGISGFFSPRSRTGIGLAGGSLDWKTRDHPASTLEPAGTFQPAGTLQRFAEFELEWMSLRPVRAFARSHVDCPVRASFETSDYRLRIEIIDTGSCELHRLTDEANAT